MIHIIIIVQKNTDKCRMAEFLFEMTIQTSNIIPGVRMETITVESRDQKCDKKSFYS